MKLRYVLLGAFAIILAVIAVAFVFYQPPEQQTNDTIIQKPFFNIVELGRAGNYGYLVYDMRGAGNLTLVSYRLRGFREVTLINDNEGIEANRITDLAEKLKPLEKYGYTLRISERRTLGRGIYVVATGAMPNYVLDDLKNNASDGIVVYIGRKDLVLRGGTMYNESWYSELTPEQKDRLLIYDGTLGSYLDSGQNNMSRDLMENRWSYESSETFAVSGTGKQTKKIALNNSKYIRVIYELGGARGITDSVELQSPQLVLTPQPEDIYTWQTATLQYDMTTTNGTVYFVIAKNGQEVNSERLRRVTDESIFVERISLKEPGEYVLTLKDNDGVIGSGMLHVKELQVVYAGKTFNKYVFNVTVDGQPMNGLTAYGSLGNSTDRRKYYVNDGELAIIALLDKGENIFNIEIEGTQFHITVINNESRIWDVYLNYGLPGLGIVLVVYGIARLSKRPVYTLRVPEGSSDIRKELRMNQEKVVDAIVKMKKDAKLRDYPITLAEFEMAVKRYLTNGADVTDGNVEEILRKLVDSGKLEQYGEYYQLPKEGDIKERSLMRAIRENLIEDGISFKETGRKFSTKDFDVGLYREKYDRKAIIVVENQEDIDKVIAEMSDRDRAKMEVKRANGLLTFVTIKKLPEVL
ncbi:MAG: hypothetical protein V1492_06120 [Candidatus Micrarchaeota archaeon]